MHFNKRLGQLLNLAIARVTQKGLELLATVEKSKAQFSKSVHKSGFALTKTRHNAYRLCQRRFGNMRSKLYSFQSNQTGLSRRLA